VSEARLPVAFAGGRFQKRPQPTRLSFDPAVFARPVAEISGVTRATAHRLAGLGLATVADLIAHYPRRYEDYRDRKRITELKVGEEATVRGTVRSVASERTMRKRVAVVRAAVSDETGTIEACWYNQLYLGKLLAKGMILSLRGSYRPQRGRATFVVKSHEILDEESDLVHTEGFVPVYPASEQVSARLLRTVLHGVLPLSRRLPDPLPARLRISERLPSKADAVTAVHQPRSPDEAREARARLVLEELLLMQVGLLLHKARERRRAKAPALAQSAALRERFVSGLPFALTEQQSEALSEIDADLGHSDPMRRLLQGDVGSGKTVVAFAALLRAVGESRQGAIMAPTETLAEQHAQTAAERIGTLATTELLTAGLSASQRRDALRRIATGEAQIVIGTHALLQGDVNFHDLAVVVVDEQHRFGVSARDELARKAGTSGKAPHMLYMTATPIPRTLALTFYGDLDVSTIAAGPQGRSPVVTRLVDESRRADGYEFVRKQLDRGRQAYVVCPAIEESESIQAATAVAEAKRLAGGEFRDYRVAVLHGQLKPARREQTMAAFKAGDVRVLVATTLVEVGIDVPNATVMMVEGADRFGLAQLHQLRGRVGRGEARSYCLLFSQAEGPSAQARLAALLDTTDGFALADRDLELRGEGQLFGSRQAGAVDLKLARLARDREALLHARTLAAALLEDDPTLAKPVNRPLAGAVEAVFGRELAWLLKA
jgi:ATP-dependent DNA helicase RecG